MRTIPATVAQLAGAACIVTASWQMSAVFGLFVAGSGLIAAGLLLDPPRRSR